MDYTYFIKQLNKIDTFNDLINLIRDICKDINVDIYGYIEIPYCKFDHLQFFGNYPKKFSDTYVKEKHILIDPITRKTFQLPIDVYTWQELLQNHTITPEQEMGFQFAKEFNIRNGVTYPIYGPNYYCGVLHFSIGERAENLLLCITKIKKNLQILGPLLGQKILLLHSNQNKNVFNLTAREIQVMIWTAKGKTVKQVGKLMHLSEFTVKTHLSNISKKLHVNNKTEAVVKLLCSGQIKNSDIWPI